MMMATCSGSFSNSETVLGVFFSASDIAVFHAFTFMDCCPSRINLSLLTGKHALNPGPLLTGKTRPEFTLFV
jgi:hypothetical protein